MRFVRFLPVLCLSVIALTACETRVFNTAQDLNVEVTGTDKAFCDVSTPHHRYHIYAPGQMKVERSSEPLKFNCTGSEERRRLVTLTPEKDGGYYRYPETISINFGHVENGTRYNGYRGSAPVVGQSAVITEEAFVAPVATSQTYPVPRTHAIVGRRSHPVPLQ